MTPAYILKTHRLLLRRFTLDDTDALAAIYADPEVMRSIGNGTTGTCEETAAQIRWYIDHYDKLGFGLWAVVERETGKLIGRAGFLRREVAGGEETEIAYLLARATWGRGYATELAVALRDWAPPNLGCHRLLALIDLPNAASMAVARKAGFVHERDITFRGKHVAVYAWGRGDAS